MNKVLEVKDLVNDLLLEANDFSSKIIQENNWVEEIFGCYLKGNPNELEEKFISCKETLEKQLETLNVDQQETALKQLLRSIADIGSYERQKRFFDIFKYMVKKGVWTSRLVCESMINSDSLTYKNGQFWVLCFDFILSLLHDVDYKGVREIMKGCCEKAQSIPPLLQTSMVSQLKGVEDVLTTIFNRDNCLLPGYFVINEIRKAHMDSTEWPHWKLNTLVSNFVESFRAVAQMVSIIGHTSMLPVVEHSGYGDHLVIPWKLDGSTLKFSIKGNIPYEEKLLEPQTHLLRYVLQQPYSRDMVCSMLGLQKTNKFHCQALEEELVELIVFAMESVENKTETDKNDTGWLWLHLSSQLIYFVLFQFAVFPNIVHSLHGKLLSKKLKKGRDHLMWVLLQFISGSIQRKPVDNFVPVLKLYDLLYSDNELLPLPDITDPLCTHKMAVTCIWIHLIFKADADNVSLQRTLPPSLKTHYEFLQMQVSPNNPSLTFGSDYRVALLCNAYSTNSDLLSRPMSTLVEAVIGPQRNLQQPPSLSASLSNNTSTSSTGPTTPLSMSILDSLTIHAKMSLIHSIVGQVIKAAQSKSNMSLPPALVETYSRLLVYTEIESLGIKGFISQLLPTVFKSHAWGILYTLLEMFSYRMHHIQPHYRVQLLSHLHSLAAVPQTNQTQLHLCVESTALRLITGLGSNEVQPHLSRFLSEPKTLVSSESEELNRALVLTLARSMHITGTGSDAQSGGWCKELLNTVMQNTPHSWAVHTLQCFPPFLSEFFHQNTVQKENKQQLKKAVEEEYRNWMSMTNDNDIIAHFTVPGTPALFLCLLWKMILETERINTIAYKVLERIGARALSAHLRKFCDYLVFKFVISEEGQHVNDCVDAINLMIWKYNIVTIDRLVLCLALRTQEGNEAQVCFFIIQLLLFKSAEFRARVQEFVKENSSEHWKHSNWHEKHSAFHKKYPEKFAAEGSTDQTSNPSANNTLPVYFGNVCLRFLPVFDIVIHRFLELPPVTKSLETLLDHLGCLYKFHDRPITYLYNTLHYYERSLRDRPALKRKLVSSILSTFCEARSPGWSLSEAYVKYMQMDNTNWSPDLEYYIKLIQRVTDTISGRTQLHSIDWRFNEFPNAAVYALYMTCVELMALPLTHTKVANSILNVIYVGYPLIAEGQMYEWLNSVGLLMSALPDSYWNVLHEHIIEAVGAPEIQNWQYHRRPFDMFNFSLVHDALLDNKHTYTLALAHATWHHAGSGQISSLPAFMKDKLAPIIKSEEQLLYLCHLIGPFLPRFNVDRPAPSIMDLAIELFNILLNVDNGNEVLNYMDPICDLLYHIKYQYVGNLMKTEVEGIIRQLRPALQRRLRFIAHLNDVAKPPQ